MVRFGALPWTIGSFELSSWGSLHFRRREKQPTLECCSYPGRC